MFILRTTLLICISGSISLGQAVPNPIFLFNVADKRSCLITDQGQDICVGQGRPVAVGTSLTLKVVNRHFMTDYFLRLRGYDPVSEQPFAGSTPTQEVNAILLEEADRATNTSKQELIEHHATSDFLGPLLAVTSASDPESEIEREASELHSKYRRITERILAFKTRYQVVVGDRDLQVHCHEPGNNNGYWIDACLDFEYRLAKEDVVHADGHALTDEKSFRKLDTTVRRLFKDTAAFAVDLRGSNFANVAQDIEADIDGYETSLNTFVSNLNAATDAVLVTDEMATGGSQVPMQIRGQLKKVLATTLASAVGDRPTLDEAEMNRLVDEYVALLRDTNSVPQQRRRRLRDAIVRLSQPSHDTVAMVQGELTDIRKRVDVELPRLVNSINSEQERLADLVNNMYDHSQVNQPLEKEVTLNMRSRSHLISCSITRSDEFRRFVVRQSVGVHEKLESESSIRSGEVPVTEGVLRIECGFLSITCSHPSITLSDDTQ